ncbi:MAG: hypothetical protein KAV87_55185 [Desulfobacteraceae bacterium]|nr:hypothetical protein [Desulfobacteraceae bacterium]
MKRRMLIKIKSFFSTCMNVKLMASIEWYRTDSDLILGFCGKKGSRGVYRYWLNQSDTWEFCHAGTKEWDRYHQKVYRQGRADPIKFNELKGKVPPVPLPRQLPPKAIRDVVDLPEKAAPYTSATNELLERINACPGRRLPAYVVLMEDRYESVLGDGTYRHFESAFFDESSAQSHIENDFEPHEFIEFHIREVHLVASENGVVLDTKGAKISPFDHFGLRQICDDLAAKIV